MTTFFVAPWARGHGLAQMIVAESEALAKSEGFFMINLDVRATQDRAIQSFEARGFKRYATNNTITPKSVMIMSSGFTIIKSFDHGLR